MQGANSTNTFGPDINEYTESVDFSILSNNSDFIYLRASGSGSGSFVMDRKFLQFAKSCKEYGIPCGGYHYAIPSSDITTAITQSDNFRDVLYKAFGDENCGELYPVIDVEVPTDGSLSSTEIVNWIEAFSNRFFKTTKRKVMLYTGTFFIQQNNNLLVPGKGYPLKNMPLWIALYPSIPGNPSIPPNIGGWTSWLLWQYTQGGQLEGVGNPVDLNHGPISLVDLMPPQNIDCLKAYLSNGKIYTSWCPVEGNNIWGYNIFVNSNYAGTVPEAAKSYVINGSNFYLPKGKDITITIEAFDKFGGVSLKRTSTVIKN